VETYQFNVLFYDQPVANSVPDEVICSSSGTNSWELSDFTSTILGSQDSSQFTVSYHLSALEAETNSNPIALPGVINLDNNITNIFARIENNDSADCYEVTSFNLGVFSSANATPFTFTQCDDSLDGSDTNGFTVFNLGDIDSEVLGGLDPLLYDVSYHRTIEDADMRINPILSPYTNTNINSDQVVARVENIANTDCYGTAVIDLVVESLPVVALSVELKQCDNDTDGISSFNLTESESLISANWANETFTYHTNLSDAQSGINAILDPLAYNNTDPSSNADVLYVRVENLAGCYRTSELDLLVSTTQIPLDFDLVYEVCDDYTVDNDNTNGISSFDFSDATAEITGLYPSGQNITVSYYQTIEDALSETNAIVDISDYRNESSPFLQRLVVRVDSDVDNACLGLGEHITLRTVNPNPNRDPDNLILCDDTNPGDLSEVFDLTQNESYILNGESNVFASYHLSLEDAENNVGAISTPESYSNSLQEETIYVRVTNSLTGCYARVSFSIRVDPLPVALSVTNLLACEDNSDGIFDFDLESKTTEVLGGQDPSIYQVSYHQSQGDAEALSNSLSSPYTNISNPQMIYVAITNSLTGCSVSSQTFLLEVEEAAVVNPDGIPIVYELCDTVNANDGSTQFDLSTQSLELLDGQDPSRFELSYHSSIEDALTNSNPLPLLYENLTNPQVIYARVSNSIAPDICFDIGELTLQVNLLPIVELEERYVLCARTNGSEVVITPPFIDTGLSGTAYSFQWSYNGDILPLETAPSILATQSGIYSVVVTDIGTYIVTSCSSSASTEVIDSDLADLEAEVTTLAFSDRHVIEATATGIGNYEYSLDEGPWQASGLFEDVSQGTHRVAARDRNGCGIVSVEVEVMDYPLYFTPNGDGTNDRWRIPGLENQPNAKIYIFDRYGKLLKQLSPLGEGWDGSYNGSMMPSDDYWFTINYEEPSTGDPKVFKAHFTLKR
jgi:gliding motility-associated-like protein